MIEGQAQNNRLSTPAKRNCHDGPNTTVIKLLQFGEAVVKHLTAVFGIAACTDQSQDELLAEICELFEEAMGEREELEALLAPDFASLSTLERTAWSR